jgi:hypothetical protein
MTQWFQERYISRGEHQEIVEYYRKLVAHLHHTVRDLRAQVDAQALNDMVLHSHRLAERETQRAVDVAAGVYGDNVILFPARRPPSDA